MMTTSRGRFGLGLALALVAQLALVGGLPRPAAAAPTETIVLAGGCFWGMEAVFGDLNGVKEAMPGYSGGAAATAHYDMVSTGTTGHAESVRVTYDPAKISLDQILTVYFTVAHDPTELNRQGPDDGTQYRSAIFVANAEQRERAAAMIARLTAEHKYSAPIVTKLETFKAFYPAEAYHRNYVALHPDQPYIVINDLPKVAALKKTFPQLVAQK
jgi:peptide-methionine (S)-S-oxide reductase